MFEPWQLELQTSWYALERMRAAIDDGLKSGLDEGAPRFTKEFEEACYGMLLVHAYSMLEITLRNLRDRKTFGCDPKSQLDGLMKKSRGSLRWNDYELVKKGRECRNHLVHQLAFPGRADALTYVVAVGNEIAGWVSPEQFPTEMKTIVIDLSVVEKIADTPGLLNAVRSVQQRKALELIVPTSIEKELREISNRARRAKLLDTYRKLPKVEVPTIDAALFAGSSAVLVTSDESLAGIYGLPEIWGLARFEELVRREVK